MTVPTTAPTPRASDLAYRVLKQEIITLQLPPGSVLNEAALMSRLKVGRTPLREAIQRLALERMVVVLPRQGTIISSLSVQDLHDIVEVRYALEGLSARLAAARATAEEMEHLAGIVREMERLAGETDYEGLIQKDQEFHRYLARLSRNSYVQEMLDNLNSQSLRFWYLSFTRVGRLGDTLQEHWHICEAVNARNADEAEASIRRHIDEFKKKVMLTL